MHHATVHFMSSTSIADPDEHITGSWASESLPMSVRKELLERELRKLGFRRAEGQRNASEGGASAQQQSQSSQHPQADAPGGHGE